MGIDDDLSNGFKTPYTHAANPARPPTTRSTTIITTTTSPPLDELMEKAGYPPQYGPKDEERLPLRGASPKRVRVRDGGGGWIYERGEDRMPSPFFIMRVCLWVMWVIIPVRAAEYPD